MKWLLLVFIFDLETAKFEMEKIGWYESKDVCDQTANAIRSAIVEQSPGMAEATSLVSICVEASTPVR